MIGTIIQTGLVLSTLPHGGGYHFTDINPLANPWYILKVLFVTRFLYLLIITAVKMSILLFYLRVSPAATFRIWVKTTMTACMIGEVLFSFIVLFSCNPIAKSWDPMIPGRCLYQIGIFKAVTVFSLVTNIVILVLPLHMIWNLHMALKRRLFLLAVLAMGILPILSLVIRLTVTHDSRKSYREYGADPTWNTVFVQNWEAVEYGSGLVCASIVHLKPLLRHLKPDSLGSAFTANRSRREQTYNNVPSYPLRARDSWHWNGPWDGTRHVRLVIREGRSDERTESPEGIITVTTELETREAARVGAVLPEYPKQAY
ncbi:hypothetical protein MMC21_003066 [Puttea exsequens]|nr:hypothetical protein [Puttea exsequens]